MKSRIFILWILFGLAVLAQWAVPLYGIWKQERVISNGTRVRLKCGAPDPYDPLRGRYLAVTIEPATVPRPNDGSSIMPNMPIFLSIEPAADGGVSKVTGVSAVKPASGIFIAAHSQYNTDEEVRIQWPIDRYYLNENLAPEADQWISKIRTEKAHIFAEIQVQDGVAVLVDLTQDGKSLREVLKTAAKH